MIGLLGCCKPRDSPGHDHILDGAMTHPFESRMINPSIRAILRYAEPRTESVEE